MEQKRLMAERIQHALDTGQPFRPAYDEYRRPIMLLTFCVIGSFLFSGAVLAFTIYIQLK